MITIQQSLDDKIRLMLEEAIQRYCYRHGRHGELYLLEKGLRDGLIEALIPKIKELIHETTS